MAKTEAKIGDRVRFLNSVGGGRIVKIQGEIAHVEEDDGFETPVLLRECIVVAEAPAPKAPAPKPQAPQEARAGIPAPAIPQPEPEPQYDYEEIDGNEALNIVIGFEATQLKKLDESTFEAYLINDSNYFVAFAWLTRADEERDWRLRRADTVEPNTEIFLGTIRREDLPSMDRMMLQYFAFKREKPFTPKAPGCVELGLNTTKFAKYHCFQPNQYFEEPVIAVDMVRADKPVSKPFDLAEHIEPKALAQAMTEKRPERRKVSKRSHTDVEELVIDLHINELVDNTRGLSNADMLNLQIDKFRQVMDAHLGHKGMKLIFIHGKGEGILRHALLKELKHRYKYHDVQDASFQQYGYGATQVTIR